MLKKILIPLIALLLASFCVGCAPSIQTDGVPDPDKIVPKRDVLIANLEDKDYTIETYTSMEGISFSLDRVIAKKGNKFIDIVYGLSGEDASKVFELYCKLYSDDYYILAHNGNYVYCVSDKKTFSAAGFTSTANVGVQYIHN